MNIVTTRFGLIQVSESEIIRIPDGLVGFRAFTQFVQLPDPVVAGLTWLQSVTAPELAFGLIAPPLAISDYRVELRPGDRAALELDEERSALIYVILNRGEGGGLTVNLQGPLVFNPVRRLGRQLVLTSSRYAVRYPLDPVRPRHPPCCPARRRSARRRDRSDADRHAPTYHPEPRRGNRAPGQRDHGRSRVSLAGGRSPKMLVLSRHRDESIIIGDDIVITVVDIRGDKVRLGIAAPIEISVHRQEVYEAIQRENRQASRLDPQEARQLENLNPPIRRDVRRPRTDGF